MAWLIPTDSHQSVPPKAGAHKAHVRLDSPLPPGLRNSGTNFSLWQLMGFSPEQHFTSILEWGIFLPFLSLLNSSRQTSSSVHSMTPSGLPINRHCEKGSLPVIHSGPCVTAGWIHVSAAALRKSSLRCS